MTATKVHPASFCSSPKATFRGLKPCRKCASCMRFKQRDWASRSVYEAMQAQRTWFCTFTFKVVPVKPYGGFQLYMKRAREAGLRIRYVCAIERGDRRGRWHLHALLHCEGAYTKRQIEAPWHRKVGQSPGFTQVKLLPQSGPARDRVCNYVASYTAKEGRLHASNGYGGKAILPLVKEGKGLGDLVGAALEAFPGATVTRVDRRKTPWNARKVLLAEARATARALADEEAARSAALGHAAGGGRLPRHSDWVLLADEARAAAERQERRDQAVRMHRELQLELDALASDEQQGIGGDGN